MKKSTLQIFGTALLAGGLLTGCGEEAAITEKPKTEETENVKTEEENEAAEKEVLEEQSEEAPAESEEKVIYIETMKDEVERINAEYDRIWDEHWKPAWAKVEEDSDIDSLKGELELVVAGYDTLEDDLIALSTGQLTANKELADEYRLNFSKSVSYRKNAANAVLQGINGDAEMNDRMEESMKSIELADEYLMKAMTNLTELQGSLEIEQ